MLRLLRWLLTGDSHCHQWETVAINSVGSSPDRRIGDKYIQECKHCGKMQIFKTYNDF